ncbi:MAG: glycosyltransferase family 2 protein [Lachnospiraceae bacterium]|nr:glycosyltransferase family 2 protein [Lachnospiraceae bacterium]
MSFYDTEKELLIIIPAYNEEKNIGAVLDGLQNLSVTDIAEILVIDDASRDNTAAVARGKGVAVITQLCHMGYGSALQLGYQYAVRKDFSYVIQLDADGQHDVGNVMKIYERLRTVDDNGDCPDLVLGSRFMQGAPAYPVSFAKKAAYAWFGGIIRLLAGKKIMDPTTGLQGLGRRAFTYYAGTGHFDDKYPDANVLLQMLMLGYRVEEMPALMHQRTEGTSMHWGLGPLAYMLRMTFSVAAVWLRIRWIRPDSGKRCAAEETSMPDAEDLNDHVVS